ncbi:damage-inducible protein DinB [Leptolyngbya sp. FACHB-36]|uniref:DinB family protein n=1 Tax=Leptolyngbya sp. FACHB-36 TaxID=2692808 RepID=UPI001680E79E|nr:damage-inducible protein DinB [Leptolyngbya sp. FACHB-36]
MYDGSYYQLMAEYNCWMNQSLYSICSAIPDAKRKQDLGAFFKSIHGTLNHLLYGDKAWMGRFTNQPFSATRIGQDLYADFDALRADREKTDQQILEWSMQLDSDWLSQPFEYTSNVDGKRRVLPTWVLVTHLFNHQTHHRGQVTTLIKQLGYEPGATDIPWLPSVSKLID